MLVEQWYTNNEMKYYPLGVITITRYDIIKTTDNSSDEILQSSLQLSQGKQYSQNSYISILFNYSSPS